MRSSAGARIYAEVIGYGSSADAYHMAAPHTTGRGAALAMRMALRKAAAYGVTPDQIDYINAHGTATRLNDIGETMAIKQVLGEHAYNVRISSTKSMTGHLLGAAGALETIIGSQGDSDWQDPAHDQPAESRPRVRSELHAQRSCRGRRQGRAIQQLWLWRAQCLHHAAPLRVNGGYHSALQHSRAR